MLLKNMYEFLLSKNLKVRIYKTVILPVVLYGCETWTLTLREEQRLRVFENKGLRKIFGAKRDEVTGEWRKLHNTELHALYSSPDIIRNIKSRRLSWAGHVARMGECRNAYRVLVRRPEGKRPLGRPRRRWEDNIKMDLREVGYEDREWINFGQDRDRWRAYVRAAMNLRGKTHVFVHLPSSATVPGITTFRNISIRIHSLRALPRTLLHLGRAIGMDPVPYEIRKGIRGQQWVSGGDKKRNQESGSDREESSEKIKGASVSGNLGCGSESVGGNKRGIEEEEEEEGNRKKDRDRNKAETSSNERSEPATAEDIAMLIDTINKWNASVKSEGANQAQHMEADNDDELLYKVNPALSVKEIPWSLLDKQHKKENLMEQDQENRLGMEQLPN
ncbi:hypothetical protein ANN_05785 [Periplaneta americana]|uniref:Uncharacterized protein n=1 Tax=Periplaneta americana TaxID=6978 RepID=A0ABQ8TBS0_PERAM|nr:hypothetical protein ANN_05785 [Periplaneta americana]